MRAAVGAALGALVVALPVGAVGDPGVTPTQLLLGATAQAGSEDAAVLRGAAAYFAHVNARGGVHGRSVALRVADDGSDPELALEATRRLVEVDRVLALVSQLGSEEILAVRDYANRARVPQLFAGSGLVALGRTAARFPWTIGYRPTLVAEGRIYGRFLVRTRSQARVAVLVEDGLDGEELLAGLRAGLARSKARILAVERSDEAGSEASTQIEALRVSGADVLAVFARTPVARRAFAAVATRGWRPFAIVDARASSGSLRPPAGAVSASFVKRPNDRRWAADPGMRLYRSILARHAAGARAADVLHLQGMAVAHTTVEVLRAAGREPTRAAVMARARSLRSAANPFLLPGIVVATSAADGFPLEQLMLERWDGRAWSPFGGLWR